MPVGDDVPRSLGAIVADGYRRLFFPLLLVVGVLVFSALIALAVAVPLYFAATRATIVYNIGVGILLLVAVVAWLVSRIVRRARAEADQRAYLASIAKRVLLTTGRVVGSVAVAYLSTRAFALSTLLGVIVAVPALIALGLIAGVRPGKKPQPARR